MNQWDYIEAGFRVFGLHGVTDGVCDCGNPDCEALYKHPRVKSWQHTPHWSDEQLDNMEYAGHFDTGFGVLCNGWLIIDVDARNGGVASYKKLCEKIPEVAEAGFVVNTGSGGGSQHVYFKAPDSGSAFLQSHNDYPGIDFKTSGYVVGAGSLHASGLAYEADHGAPDDITDAPDGLVDLLRKPERHRAIISDQIVDVATSEIRDMLSYCHGFDDYHTWVTTGMAIHHATGGSNEGRAIWADWSAKSDKYDPEEIDFKWPTFGKCTEPVTLGSIFFEATQNGYVQPVTFNIETGDNGDQSAADESPSELPFDTSHVDLRMPPGFVGKVVQWINEISFYKRERIAAATALTAIGNLGMHWRDDISEVAPNLMFLCVSGSGTGKEAQNGSFAQIMRAGNMQMAIHGDIKSKQEIMRNLIENQIAAYCTDEIGELLRLIENAKKKGGAAYLEGITGEIMKVFTKSDETLLVSGDLRRELMQDLRKKAAAELKIVDEQKPGAAFAEKRLESLNKFIGIIESEGGIPKPFFSLLGFATPESFEPALSVELAKNGFLNRAFIVQEIDTNPRPNLKRKKIKLPYTNDILRISSTGKTRDIGERIEVYDLERKIRTEPPANDLMAQLFDWQWHFSEYHKEHTGFEALGRRAYEFISKVSLVLAIGDNGVRTVEHVKWAAAFVKSDIDHKIRLLQHIESKDSKDEEEVVRGIKERIISLCQDATDGIFRSQIHQRVKRKDVKPEQIETLLDAMVERGMIYAKGKKLYGRKP